MIERGLAVLSDDDALAGSESIILNNVGSAKGIEGGFYLFGGVANMGESGGNFGCGHDLLGEGLRTFELRCLAARSEARNSGGAYGVGHTGDERGFGADDDKVDAKLSCQQCDSFTIHRINMMEYRAVGHTRISWRGVHLLDLWVARKRQGKGMLAAAAADHKGLHREPAYRQSQSLREAPRASREAIGRRNGRAPRRSVTRVWRRPADATN